MLGRLARADAGKTQVRTSVTTVASGATTQLAGADANRQAFNVVVVPSTTFSANETYGVGFGTGVGLHLYWRPSADEPTGNFQLCDWGNVVLGPISYVNASDAAHDVYLTTIALNQQPEQA